MIVDLIAYTVLVPEAVQKLGYMFHEDNDVTQGDELAEIAGRECYQSWKRPNPATATSQGYLANILDRGHFSVLEHYSLTFSLREVSRSLTHELVRHRHLSFSQVSQRYVDESNGEFITPPEIELSSVVPPDLLTDAHHEAVSVYEKIVATLTDAGVPRKRARQAARYVLPNGHVTRLIVSGNLRTWREFVIKRGATDADENPLADLEMHELATRIHSWLQWAAPNAVQDLK